MNRDGPIGIFDSGAGGLTVWREITRAMPNEDTIYFADQVHMPYGPRTQTELQGFCDGITRFLASQGCKAVVVACNTASAAALKYLRETFPDLPSIGLEPAVKPAAAVTKSGVVGIMATPATFQGKLFQATAGRHAGSIKLINQVCDGLADQVEHGDTESVATEAMLRGFLAPMLAAGADTVVLACTHYPFVIECIRRIVGPEVRVIDPAPSVARHVRDTLIQRDLQTTDQNFGRHRFLTSGSADRLSLLLSKLVGVTASADEVRWQGANVIELPSRCAE